MLEHNNPEITEWIVTYDSDGLPGQVSGIMSGDYKNLTGGQMVNLRPFSIDLRNNTMNDNAGQVWKLTGPGFQSILVKHLEPVENLIIQIVDDENDGEEEND